MTDDLLVPQKHGYHDSRIVKSSWILRNGTRCRCTTILETREGLNFDPEPNPPSYVPLGVVVPRTKSGRTKVPITIRDGEEVLEDSGSCLPTVSTMCSNIIELVPPSLEHKRSMCESILGCPPRSRGIGE